jgi:ubiquinone/menaquinone biosynthesis C-methylase UbiE
MWQKIIDGQYRRPSGILGRWVGRKMVQQHLPENTWTVQVVNPQPNDVILEIGFGPGIAITQVAQRVTDGLVAGIDFSQTMVNVAKKRNQSGAKSGIVDLRYADVVKIPFADATFDKAYSIHSIYFWQKPLVALQEIHRVMKVDGTLILTILPREKWNIDNPEQVVGTPECTPYSAQELETLLNQTGFNRVRVEADPENRSNSNYSVIACKAI